MCANKTKTSIAIIQTNSHSSFISCHSHEASLQRKWGSMLIKQYAQPYYFATNLFKYTLNIPNVVYNVLLDVE